MGGPLQLHELHVFYVLSQDYIVGSRVRLVQK